jgi:threonylcarbamoyladenosine tRNA methylthiotransferase MtaB
MRVFLDSIGCRLNQSEIEKIGNQMIMAGHLLVDNPQEADLVIVNTCAVTTEAASDSRQKIRQAGRNPKAEIVVTGCWATMEPDAASKLPGVKHVVLNDAKDDITNLFPQKTPVDEFELEPLIRKPLPGIHSRTRVFIKTQDGCNNHCTFCVTRLVRGTSRSIPISEVLADIQHALNGGVQEAVLTGVQLGSWGQEYDPPQHLVDLIKIILEETSIPRLRMSSIEPWDLDERFFSLWQDPRLCRHFHLPLQSGAVATLKRMARKITPEDYRSLLLMIRHMIPDAAITTDILVGFPGETEEDFTESLAFVKEMHFAAGHVFSFSPRPGTAAARMDGQVHPKVRKERSLQMRQVLEQSSLEFRQQFIGKEMHVLWETSDRLDQAGWQLHGLTDNYLRVRATSPELRWNKIDRVILTELTENGLAGQIIH